MRPTLGTDSKQMRSSTSQSSCFFTCFFSNAIWRCRSKNSSCNYDSILPSSETRFIRLKYNWKWCANDRKLFVSRTVP